MSQAESAEKSALLAYCGWYNRIVRVINFMDSIIFDEKNKVFTILRGSLGNYQFNDVASSQIVYEDAKYKDKSPMFSHRILVSTLNHSIFIEMKKVYVGIEIQLLNGNKVYAYISKSPVIQHNFQFKQDLKVAKCLNVKLKEFYK